MGERILEVKDLAVEFHTDESVVKAISDVSFDVHRGKTLGIVGESGCGKSVSALSITRLIPHPPGKIIGGRILYRGENLLTLPLKEMREIRGNHISMIFQEPMTSLNPVFTVGNQIEESLKLHRRELSRKQRKEKVVESLRTVGIPNPDLRAKEYPHQMSGGMRQRAMIAMALACHPDILIADEPTTALDVTIQAQILGLMENIQREMGMGIILITHDLGVVAETCDTVAVMYCGQIVETAPVGDLFKHPRHPYTKGLLDSMGTPRALEGVEKRKLSTIAGLVPDLAFLPKGCRFQDRCSHVTQECRGPKGEPKLIEGKKGHAVRCFHPLTGEAT